MSYAYRQKLLKRQAKKLHSRRVEGWVKVNFLADRHNFELAIAAAGSIFGLATQGQRKPEKSDMKSNAASKT